MLAEREVVDAAVSFPIGQAAPQVALEPGGALVALLGCLGEQLHGDPRDWRGDGRQPLAGGAGCRAMWQCTQSIGSTAANGNEPVSI